MITAKSIRPFLCLILGSLFHGCQSLRESEEVRQRRQALVDTQLALAQQQLDEGRPEEALEMLRSLSLENGDQEKILNMLGLAHLSLGNNKTALELFQRAYEQKSSEHVHLNLSSALLALGRNLEARHHLKELLKSSYGYRERIYHNLALSYEQEKNWKKAQEFYEQALVEHPTYHLSQYRLALIYFHQGKKTQAFSAMKKAIRYCPICWEPRKIWSQWLWDRGEKHQARKALQAFLNIKNLNPQEKARAKEQLKRF